MKNNLRVYNAFRSRIQSMDIIEWHSKSILGWAIRKITKKNVNHTSLVIRFNEYDIERVFVIEALEHGITVQPLSNRLAAFKGQAYLLCLKPEFRYDRKIAAQWAISKLGTKYDYKSLFKQVAQKVSPDAKKLFCSEFAYLALNHGGIVKDLKKAPRPGEIETLGVTSSRIQLL